MSETTEMGEMGEMSDDRFPAPGTAALAADGSLLLGARRIPLPASVSPQARAFLAMPRVTLGDRPPLADKEAWRRWVTTMNLGSEPRVAQMMALVGDRVRLATRAPGSVAISGASAGGNIAAAAALKARDLGLALPGALGLFTPECDLTESGDSFVTNLDVDNVLPGPLPEEIALYADGADLRDPYLSPLFGDFTPGYPPTQIQTGTRDLFLSNSVRMHRALRAAGVTAELHVWEAMPHGGFGFDAPENADARREFNDFLERHLG